MLISRRLKQISFIFLCVIIFSCGLLNSAEAITPAAVTNANPLKWIPQNSGTTSSLTGIAYGNQIYVVTSINGLILTSRDGINWVSDSDAGKNSFWSVTYNPNTYTFVAVGSGGTIVTGTDGYTWTLQNSGTTNTLSAITFANGLYLAVGENGTILYSTDAIKWNTVVSIAPEWLFSVTYYNDHQGHSGYVATGDSGVILQSPDGVQWTSRPSGITSSLYGVAASPTQIIAVGANGIGLMSVDGGISWTQQTISQGIDFWGVAYGGQYNEFAAVGSMGVVAKSHDGVNWTENEISGITSPLTAITNGMIRGGGQFVTVGQNGVIFTGGGIFTKIIYALDTFIALGEGDGIFRSDNAALWTPITANVPAVTCNPHDMIFNYDEDMLVAWGTDSGSACVLTSTDLVHWTQQDTADGNSGICYGNHLYISANNSTIRTSTDGIAWSNQIIDVPDVGPVACSNNVFLALADGGTDFVRSTDGFHWGKIPNTGPVGSVYSNIIGGDQFMAVGDAEYGSMFMMGGDGLTWNIYYPAGREVDDGSITGAVIGTNATVAIAPGYIFTSKNSGASWTKQTASINTADIIYGNGIFVILDGTIITSPDGIIWTDQVTTSKK